MIKSIAVVLLYNDEKKFLLQLRTLDAPTFPGIYGFFGGRIEEGETPEAAIRRECLEELEYELENPELVLSSLLESGYGKRNVHLFLEKYDPQKKLVLHEGQSMGWFDKEEAGKLVVSDFLADILIGMYDKI
jgi:8-oxo-dGTP diphosphatase